MLIFKNRYDMRTLYRHALLLSAFILSIIAVRAQSAGPDQNTCLYTVIKTAATGSGRWSSLATNQNNIYFQSDTSPVTYASNFIYSGVYGLVWTSGSTRDTMYVTVASTSGLATPAVSIIPARAYICAGDVDTFRLALRSVNAVVSIQWYDNWWYSPPVTGTDSIRITPRDSVSVIVTATAACASQPILLVQQQAIVTRALPASPAITATGTCANRDTLQLHGGAGNVAMEWYLTGTQVRRTDYPLYVVAGGNGSGNAANQLAQPYVSAKDAAGNLYVLDTYNNRVQKFPPGSTSAANGTTVAGGNGAGSAANQLNNPYGMCVSAAGDVYVSDFNNNRVQKFPAGSTSATAGITVAGGNGPGTALNQMDHPNSIHLDAAGNLYVLDGYGLRIMKFPAGSTASTNGSVVAGGNGVGNAANQFNGVNSFDIDAAGDVFVMDDYNGGSIRVFPAGSTSATNGTVVIPVRAGYMCLDAAGSLYLKYDTTIQRYPLTGITAGPGTTIAHLYTFSPYSSIYVDGSSNIYLSDQNKYSVLEMPAGASYDSLYIPAAAGVYTATVTDQNGCTSVPSNAITMAPCLSDSVWPGDADHNGIADNNDLLPIGVAYGLNGFPRVDQSIVWTAHAANNWGVQFLSSENTKHADCNGNGVIDANDTTAILANFGLTHSKTDGSGAWRSGIPGITLRFSKDTVTAGDTLVTSLILGDSITSVAGLYGLAFTFHYDPLVCDSTTTRFDFPTSFLGTAANKISLHKDFRTAGQVKAAVTGIDHLNRNGYGLIARFSCIITTDNLNGKDLLYHTNTNYISDILAVDKDGISLPINAATDSNQVSYEPNGVADISATWLSLRPNPASGTVMIGAQSLITQVSLTDMLGRMALVQAGSQSQAQTIDVSALAPGVYTVHITTLSGSGSARLVVAR